MKRRQTPIYATLKKRFTTDALRALQFVHDGSRMVKLGACRRERAIAYSLDGESWRVTPLERGWKH
jgi:hypothetical protein